MAEFEWEDRYVVIKRKHLNEDQARKLYELLDAFDLPPIEAVVVESDWPEYWPTRDMIKARVEAQ